MSRKVFKYLNSVGAKVVKDAKANLSNKSSSGSLRESIGYDVVKKEEGYSLMFTMAEHGEYIDKGVSGKKVARFYTDLSGSKKQMSGYTNKMPPPSALDKWIVRKGLEGVRNEKGQFIPRKSLQFLIARSIYFKGIQGISFFTKPLGEHLGDVPYDIFQYMMQEFKENITEIIKK
tara:strand:- start:12902 stop:13426 length:525 start_codon:yes stop_codon:yes gene_type:complete